MSSISWNHYCLLINDFFCNAALESVHGCERSFHSCTGTSWTEGQLGNDISISAVNTGMDVQIYFCRSGLLEDVLNNQHRYVYRSGLLELVNTGMDVQIYFCRSGLLEDVLNNQHRYVYRSGLLEFVNTGMDVQIYFCRTGLLEDVLNNQHSYGCMHMCVG